MITVFGSLFATHGDYVARANSGSLCNWLAKPGEYGRKDRAKRWGAFRSADGRRRREDMIEATALVFDLDQSAPKLEAAVDALADHHAFIASTWSATEQLPRWRVVLFLSRPVTPLEFPRVQRAGLELLERVAEVDRGALDVTHIFSAPATRPGGFFRHAETEGEALDVGAALNRFPEEQPLSATKAATVRNASRYARAALSSACAEIAATGPGGRNYALNRETFPLGRFIARGELDEVDTIDALVAAGMAAGISRREATYTVRRALRQKIVRSA